MSRAGLCASGRVIEGEIVMMAAKGFAHERIKSALPVAIARALPGDLRMGVEITLRLTDTIMLEPDIALFAKKLFSKPVAGFVQLDPGDANLVIEVAASSLSMIGASKPVSMRVTACANTG
jgi:hypothetical protein